jgi:uncharacterized protein
MDHKDRQAIEALFGKLANVEHQSGPRDSEAEAFIRSKIASQLGAPYFMAQTVIVQEQALNAAQARIANLEQQLASRPAGGGGFLSGLFGGGGQPQHRPPQPDNTQGMMPPGSRFGVAPGMQGIAAGRGGGFLAGAAQTAMGVAGGVLLGNIIANAVGGGDDKTAEAGQSNPSAEPAAASGDEGDFGEDLGGDFGEDV